MAALNGKPLWTNSKLELKEELKKRGLKKSGTKKDLVERLGESITAKENDVATFRLRLDQENFYLTLQSDNCLKRLADKKGLHDVSIQANDGFSVTANKCVLSSRSTFFEKIFDDKPFLEYVLLLCLDGYELLQMFRLIYGFEISVKKTNLPKVLENKSFLGIH